MNPLKDVIRESGLLYKQVGALCGRTANQIAADAATGRLSVEKAILYGRALRICPSKLRPDFFKPGDVVFVTAPPPPPEASPEAAAQPIPKRRHNPHKRAVALPAEAAAPPRPVSLSGRPLKIQRVLPRQ